MLNKIWLKIGVGTALPGQIAQVCIASLLSAEAGIYITVQAHTTVNPTFGQGTMTTLRNTDDKSSILLQK